MYLLYLSVSPSFLSLPPHYFFLSLGNVQSLHQPTKTKHLHSFLKNQTICITHTHTERERHIYLQNPKTCLHNIMALESTTLTTMQEKHNNNNKKLKTKKDERDL